MEKKCANDVFVLCKETAKFYSTPEINLFYQNPQKTFLNQLCTNSSTSVTKTAARKLSCNYSYDCESPTS